MLLQDEKDYWQRRAQHWEQQYHSAQAAKIELESTVAAVAIGAPDSDSDDASNPSSEDDASGTNDDVIDAEFSESK